MPINTKITAVDKLVLSTSTLIVPANSRRMNIILCNPGDEVVYLMFKRNSNDPNPTTTSGIALMPMGGSYELDISLFPFTGEIWGIAESVASQVTGLEHWYD